jgi:hypothetical protein
MITRHPLDQQDAITGNGWAVRELEDVLSRVVVVPPAVITRGTFHFNQALNNE